MHDLSEIKAVGYRELHAGKKFSEPVLVNADMKKVIEECIYLRPLRNSVNLNGIKVFEVLLPDISQVTVFDTAFHQTMYQYAYMYALSYECYEKHGIRKYNFHGTSHRFVSKCCIELLVILNIVRLPPAISEMVHPFLLLWTEMLRHNNGTCSF